MQPQPENFTSEEINERLSRAYSKAVQDNRNRPIRASDLLELDKRLQVVEIGSYDNAEQVVYQAGRGDYSEIPVHELTLPDHEKCGEWIVKQLLSNDRGHWGPLEHPAITLSVSGYVHNVMVQARTHRVGISFDVQSQRYTGKRVLKVASSELEPDEVFYSRPPGFYTNRQGTKYEWTLEDYGSAMEWYVKGAKRYAYYYDRGFAEEHIRDELAQGIRQNFVVSFNLRSVLHFLDLRSKLDAQLEIQALCEQIAPELQRWAPNVWEYYEQKRLHRAKLSP
jgi:thymidylate synthase (FAD)